MGRVDCPIWESCKHQATSTCFHCSDNAFAEGPSEECYDFNNWDEKENDWENE